MFKRYSHLLKFSALLFMVLPLHGAVANDDLPNRSSSVTYGDHTSGSILVIGSVTNNPKYTYGLMQDISAYVLEKVKTYGVDAVEVFTVDTHAKMLNLLNSERVDWISATPYAALLYESQANAEILAAKNIRGNANYRSVFFTRLDSGVNSIGDLVDKVIAFEKIGSTSAHFLPATEILNAGYQLVELDSPLDRPPPGTIGYVFSGDEANSSIWTHKRIVAAGAFSDEDWSSNWNMPESFRKDMKIFHRSKQVPRSLEVVRGGLDENIKAKLKQTLFAANTDPAAAEALRNYHRASEIRELSAGQLNALEVIRQAMEDFENLSKKPHAVNGAPVKVSANETAD